MSECTKGEWTVSGKLPYIIATTAPPYRLSGKTIISRGLETGGQDWPAISNEEREANAKELVLRWNAFEEGGIVEELRKACEKVLSKPELHYQPLNTFEIEALETALAKC